VRAKGELKEGPPIFCLFVLSFFLLDSLAESIFTCCSCDDVNALCPPYICKAPLQHLRIPQKAEVKNPIRKGVEWMEENQPSGQTMWEEDV